ncbi:hypothetical protein D3C85_1635830 [compost metagenome]
MSTLNEIAMNHARLAKQKAEEMTDLSDRRVHIVVSFEVAPLDVQQNAPLHLIASAQDSHKAHTVGYAS